MKVLVAPGVEARCAPLWSELARAMAGPGGDPVSLSEAGIRTLDRQLSAAEVALIRSALAGEETMVGYLCAGRSVPCARVEASEDAGAAACSVVAVCDHVNLAWRSPLTGPNDGRYGPRFPSMTDIYAPDVVVGSLQSAQGIIVGSGMVAGVRDAWGLSQYESEAVLELEYAAMSSELVPVVILAAHMGLKVAAAVIAKRS